MTKVLLGLDAVADAESRSCVCGIATDFVSWSFFRSLDDWIEREDSRLWVLGGMVQKSGLPVILRGMYTLLSDD